MFDAVFDAIVIPGGGLLPDHTLPPWVLPRFERALALRRAEFVLPLSAGSPHRPSPFTAQGGPVFEAHVGAEWLVARGVPEDRVLPESLSFDTIGNAFFARLLHTDPRGLRRLHVITSEFHLPRARAIFDWVFGLDGAEYRLTYEGAPNAGLSLAVLAARQEKERAGLAAVSGLPARIQSLAELHRWLFTEHEAYRATRPAWRRSTGSEAWRDSY